MRRNRWIGPVLVALGAVSLTIGLAGLLGGSDATTAAESATPTTTGTVTASSVAPATTSTADTHATADPPSTTRVTTASTTSSTTSTTTTPIETIESFVLAYAAALEAGDSEFVFSRLHEATVDGWGQALCTTWVDREIMALSDYRLVSVNAGPVTRIFTTPAGSVSLDEFYDATVSFVFSGQTFESTGAFARIGTEIFWLGQCR